MKIPAKKIKTITIVITIFTYSCSSTKYVPNNEYLLNKAVVKVDAKDVSAFDLEAYIKQKPNFKTFEVFKVPLFMYNLSGQDTTRWYNKALRSGGEAPVIYDSTQVSPSVDALSRIMTNLGYINAKVEPKITLKDKKADIDFIIKSGDATLIDNYIINISDTVLPNNLRGNKLNIPQSIKQKIKNNADSLTSVNEILKYNTILKKGDRFNLELLDSERDRITSLLRQYGFWTFNKEYIGFIADTLDKKNAVDLELVIYPFIERGPNNEKINVPHKQFMVDKVDIYVDYDPLIDGDLNSYIPKDTITRGNYRIFYGKDGNYIKPFVILGSTYIQPNRLYNEEWTNMTYNAMSQLSIMRNVNIRYDSYLENDTIKLKSVITAVPDKKQGISTEIEGTNSAGFFGIGSALGYTHRNLFRGSELFDIKVRGSYEAVTPNFTSFMDNYFEMGGEMSLTFPRFMFPFLKKDLRKKLKASTQFVASYTFQRRPDYFTRTVFSTGIKYIWEKRRNGLSKHTFDLIDISYVHIPKLYPRLANTLSDNARLYSFTDQFIVGMSYTYSRTNANVNLLNNKTSNFNNRSTYSFRGSIESAGNGLYLFSLLANIKEENGSRKIFDTFFAQYIKGNMDYSKTIRVDEKNSIAWRLGAGIVYPYGNNKLVPFQKRFFAGGANSVRGWNIRELGPGFFYLKDANFNDQSGDIRFDANIEYRSKLFWKLEGAAFLDAGNIWTIRGTERQYKGEFKFDRFYKQIASAWGLGIRLDLKYVLIRLDCGWKLYDPADIPKYKTTESGYDVPNGYRSKWKVVHPFKISKNTAWHIAVGYPF